MKTKLINPRNFVTKYSDYLIIALVASGLIFLFHKFSATQSEDLFVEYPVIKQKEKSLDRFGYKLEEYSITEQKFKKNQFIGDILSIQGIDYKWIDMLERKSKNIFSVRKFRAGKNYTPFYC